MSPELSRTVNKLFPYLIMDGGTATLLSVDAAQAYFEGLAKNMDMTPDEVEKYLEEGGKIDFTWAEDEPTQDVSTG